MEFALSKQNDLLKEMIKEQKSLWIFSQGSMRLNPFLDLSDYDQLIEDELAEIKTLNIFQVKLK